MTRRIFLQLIILSLPLVISACGTTPTQPVQTETTEQSPTQTETFDDRAELIRPGFWKDPSRRSLSEIMSLSRSMPFYQVEVALEIIRSLESIDSSRLAMMIDSQSYDPEFTGWLELALQLRTLMIGNGPVSTAAQDWENYHPGHPVTQSGFRELLSAYSSFYPVPSKVAVLLPTEGGLSAASAAIRDGLLSAYLDHPGDASLRFYSSGTDGESAVAAYRQATEDGATQVIGPLRRDSAHTLATVEDLHVPVLLLNRTKDNETDPLSNTGFVNSLSLSQSEEATAVAHAVLDNGYKSAIVMVPDSAWGRRIEAAFTNGFESGGGLIVGRALFDRTANDYSDMLTQLLKIDESLQRKRALQSQIGTPLSFEPSRRHDFDFIFLAANPQEGRELKPLLRFHDAGEVPVFSIGRVYNGRAERARDQDLDGVIFTAVPWQMMPEEAQGPIPASLRDGSLGELYALGKDAWHLLPWLPLMQKDTELRFPGQIGALRLQENGQIERHPAWAQFVAGTPTLYQWPNRH